MPRPSLRIATGLLCLLMTLFATLASAREVVEVLTDVWPPYINAESHGRGSAARVLEILGTEADLDVEWRYTPYSLAYELVRREKALFAFPYFRTQRRANEVLFSKPVFSARSGVYFNRRFLTAKRAAEAFDALRIGRVEGYSYGEKVDRLIKDPIVFPSEMAALQALFGNNIDLLPMTEGVMKATLARHFPNREQLILPVPGIADTSTLHIIAAKSRRGQSMINRLDAALNRVRTLGISTGLPQADEQRLDLARLIPAEGYPVILGQLSADPDTRFFALPQGTRVLVLEWSPRILQPSESDRLYETMINLSHVVVLSGPHVGRELFVRNMHIELL